MTENTEIARETCINDLKNKGFIDKVKVNGDIIYTEHFYREMNRLMDAGKPQLRPMPNWGSTRNCSVITVPCRPAKMSVPGKDTGSFPVTVPFPRLRLPGLIP